MILFRSNDLEKKIKYLENDKRHYLIHDEKDLISRYILNQGYWEKDLMDLAKNYLTPSSNCLDVGANLGSWSIELSKFCHQGKIFSFEPQPELYLQLCANLYINQCLNVTPYCFGLSTHEKSGTFAYMKHLATNNSGATAIREDGTIQIELKAMDDFLDRLPKIDFIKMDVEGHELFTLQGGESLLDRDRPILFIELWTSMPVESQKTRDWLITRGYQLIQLQGDDWIATPSLNFEFPKQPFVKENNQDESTLNSETPISNQKNVWFILFITISILAFIILVCLIVFIVLKTKKK